jgi:hypothetical protein
LKSVSNAKYNRRKTVYCASCGCKIIDRELRQRFCDDCLIIERSRPKPKTIAHPAVVGVVKRECKNDRCRKIFVVEHGRQVYCVKKCYEAFNSRLKKSRKTREQIIKENQRAATGMMMNEEARIKRNARSSIAYKKKSAVVNAVIDQFPDMYWRYLAPMYSPQVNEDCIILEAYLEASVALNRRMAKRVTNGSELSPKRIKKNYMPSHILKPLLSFLKLRISEIRQENIELQKECTKKNNKRRNEGFHIIYQSAVSLIPNLGV